MNNVNAILELWIKLFFGSSENYSQWLSDANTFLADNHFPYWVMDIINALPYIMTILSFCFVFYFFYLLIKLFKELINVVDDDTDDDGTASNAGGTRQDRVKTYYYFSKKPGRKKKRRYDD